MYAKYVSHFHTSLPSSLPPKFTFIQNLFYLSASKFLKRIYSLFHDGISHMHILYINQITPSITQQLLVHFYNTRFNNELLPSLSTSHVQVEETFHTEDIAHLIPHWTWWIQDSRPENITQDFQILLCPCFS
jgi:hypothetical protein